MRNVVAHAGRDGALRVELTCDDGVARLVVADDGRGFDAGTRDERRRRKGTSACRWSRTSCASPAAALDDQLDAR